MTTTSKTGLRSVTLVCVTTLEQDKAIEFYESLGFEKRVDEPFGGQYRWVEVAPAGAETVIAIAPPGPGGETGGRETGISLQTDDIDAIHADLKAAGADVDEEVSRMGDPVPPLLWFRDPDKNSLMIVEVPAA
jgi:catechol 2,3-dioxygenase-like lactoylglutathione lyase family enzyme